MQRDEIPNAKTLAVRDELERALVIIDGTDEVSVRIRLKIEEALELTEELVHTKACNDRRV